MIDSNILILTVSALLLCVAYFIYCVQRELDRLDLRVTQNREDFERISVDIRMELSALRDLIKLRPVATAPHEDHFFNDIET